MTTTRKFTIKAPVDPELNIKVREYIEYYVTLPSRFDKSQKYGLAFCIPGYGDHANSEYQSNKLRPYIANKYNLLTVGVKYHNDLRADSNNITIDCPEICKFYDLNDDYFENLYGNKQIINKVFNLLAQRNISSLDPKLAIQSTPYHRYSSFGFMPAIDHLHVLYDILNKFKIDKKNIIVYGSYYGGYIASLMGKYAPHTFSLIIDNNGFCVSDLQEVLGKEIGSVSGTLERCINSKKYEVPITLDTLWSINETSPYYFSDDHKQIRNLLIKDHRTSSDTIYCSYHSPINKNTPIEQKTEMYDLLKDYNKTYYQKTETKKSDEELFTSSIEKYRTSPKRKDDLTDFDKDICYGFPCSDKVYNFTYTSTGLEVEIEKKFY